MKNGSASLSIEQSVRFDELQNAFRARQLWVGWADSDPATAHELTVEDDHPDHSDGIDDSGDLIDFVLEGAGDPDELADEYVEILRP
jgi:hypothetical protein